MQLCAASNSQQFQQMEQFRNFLGAQLKEKTGSSDVTTQDDYETSDIPIISTRSSLHEQAIELTRLALHGCEIGERIAISHQKRPCFKKIDSLCARMKQDLLRADGVLANINSQGIAWAVKDFIFVLTRIINGWNIIKGYANNQSTADSLNKVRSALSPTFNESFFKWQEATLEFLNDLIQSFVNLDQLIQIKRHPGKNDSSVFSSSDYNCNTSNTSSTDDSSNNSYSSLNISKQEEKSLVVDNSEEAQVQHMENGTYFKTGVYNPIKAESMPDKSGHQTSPQTGLKSNQVLLSRPDLVQSVTLITGYQRQTFNANNTLKQASNSGKLEKDILKRHLLHKIENFKNGEYFFSSKFINNYFPDFCKVVPNFIDLRSIILKTQLNEYDNIYEIVQDLRQIVDSARIYLNQNPQKFLTEYMFAFERELEAILADDIFSKLDFSGITEAPTDSFNN